MRRKFHVCRPSPDDDRLTIFYRLSKGRKKRPVPEDWVTSEEVSSFATETSNALPVPQTTSLDVAANYAAVGGLNGEAAVYSIEADKLERQVAVNEPVTGTLWTGAKLVFATSQGGVKIYENGSETAALSEHSGPATALSIHPGGDVLASVGADKSIVFYSLATAERVSRAYTDAGEYTSTDRHWHPANTSSPNFMRFPP